MENVVCIADQAVNSIAKEKQSKSVGQAVKNLFMLLQGSYGALFISKFSTGVKDAAGRDMGVRSAMLVWDFALAKFSPDVLEAAAARTVAEYREYPPNLPQFVALCEAVQPRKTYAEEAGLPRLPAPAPAAPVKVDFSRQNDGKDWARSILARSEAGESIRSYTLLSARQALGLEGRMAWH